MVVAMNEVDGIFEFETVDVCVVVASGLLLVLWTESGDGVTVVA